LAPVTVRVVVRENPGISISGEPRGVVEVRDGPVTDPQTATCTITLAGTANEVGLCTLYPLRAGANTLTAQYLGFAGWDASSDTEAQAVRGLSIINRDRNEHVLGESVAVQIALDLSPWLGSPATTGSVQVSDGVESCSISLPPEAPAACVYTPTTAGEKQLRAVYAGDANYPAMTSTVVSHIVHRGPFRSG
jgi:Bacterial Ig-like domain (group 3)